MKENQRKCFKCGRSPSLDPTVKLYRFPRLGTTNTLRCETWAKYCFPDREVSMDLQRKLFSEHRMLCDHHFKPSSFIDFARKILNRSAVPENVKRVVVHVPSASQVSAEPQTLNVAVADIKMKTATASILLMEPRPSTSKESSSVIEKPGPSQSQSYTRPSKPALADITNIEKKNVKTPEPRPSTSKESPSVIEKPGPSQSQSYTRPSKPALADITNIEKNVTAPELDPGISHIENPKHKLLVQKCRRNLQKICQMRNRIKNLKNQVILKAVESNQAVTALIKKISPTLALFLQGEIKNFRRKEKGRRWTKDQKITALRLYKRSPTCYHLLRRLLTLPSPSSLKKILAQFPLKVGINNKIFTILKKVVSTQQPIENEYVLMFDEMSIRKHLQYNKKIDLIEGHQDHGNQGRSPQVVSHALVFMICGIRKKVKQPVAFYLSGSSVTADRLAVLMKEVLRECFEAAINISAIVCDMDGVNRRALGILGATAQNPTIELDNHKIVTLFDPPHLLKCFRNLFLKYDVRHTTNIQSYDGTGKGIAKWSHIQQFFDLDSKNPNFVFAPALRQEHLAPNAKQKMRVKLAAQVLSHSVAAGMFCKISQGELTTEATVTANLISNMDKLFDCVNSDTPDLKRGKPHSTNLSDRTPHLNLFKEMNVFFQSVEFIGCRSKPPSIEGWLWTLNAMEIFWRMYKNRHPTIRSLSTRRLQQDPLENLFGCIRGLCGSNTNPTASQFVAGLKTTLLSKLATAGVRGTNCENDNNEAILENLKALLSPEHEVPETIVPGTSCSAENLTDIYVPENFVADDISGEMQACAYVCGFIIKKIKNDCAVCQINLRAENVDSLFLHNFIDMKEYSNVKQSLNYASEKLIKTVEHMATVINIFLEKKSHTKDIKLNLIKLLQQIDFNFIQCVTHKDLIVKNIIESTIQICIKRFCVMKNRNFIEEASKSALRKKISILKHT